ncbi:hypothetical protein LAW_00183 [Lawsonia intracellularis N343]|nr:hypothetical protein LAW_00183 [Lawsonia intracellularis N343]
MIFMLEGALHAFVLPVFHHEIGNGTEYPLAGKRAFAHGDAFVGPSNVGYGYIETTIHEKTVQIQSLLPDPAGTERKTGCSVFLQFSVIQADAAQPCRFEIQHPRLPKE